MVIDNKISNQIIQIKIKIVEKMKKTIKMNLFDQQFYRVLLTSSKSAGSMESTHGQLVLVEN